MGIKEIIAGCDGFCYSKKCFHRNEKNKVCPKCQDKIDKINEKENKCKNCNGKGIVRNYGNFNNPNGKDYNPNMNQFDKCPACSHVACST